MNVVWVDGGGYGCVMVCGGERGGYRGGYCGLGVCMTCGLVWYWRWGGGR